MKKISDFKYISNIKILVVNKLFCIFLIVFCFLNYAYSEFGISIGWPYFGLKWDSKNIGCETRLASADGISVYSLRSYWKFSSYKSFRTFLGFEAGYIEFNTLGINGNGYELGVFLAGEYFVLKKLSVGLDFCPTFISLNAKGTHFSVDGIEFVTNVFLSYYFNFSKNKNAYISGKGSKKY